jgi:hypothetical protein
MTLEITPKIFDVQHDTKNNTIENLVFNMTPKVTPNKIGVQHDTKNNTINVWCCHHCSLNHHGYEKVV